MRGILCVLISGVIVLFSSCQKSFDPGFILLTDTTGTSDTGTTDTTGTGFHPKTYTEDVTYSGGHVVITYNMSYDSQGRLLSMISTSNTGDKFVYQYAATSYTLDLYNSNALSIHETFFLNSLSLVDSTIQYNDTKDTSTEKYLYSSGKLLLQLKEYDIKSGISALSNVTIYEYDANKNVSKEASNTGTVTYDYYSDLQNTLDIGLNYFGKNKNLTKTTTATGDVAATLQHTYTFDTLDRLTSEKVVSTDGDIVIKSYTY